MWYKMRVMSLLIILVTVGFSAASSLVQVRLTRRQMEQSAYFAFMAAFGSVMGAFSSLAGIADDIRAMPMGMQTLISEGQGGISGEEHREACQRHFLEEMPLARFPCPAFFAFMTRPRTGSLWCWQSARHNCRRRRESSGYSHLRMRRWQYYTCCRGCRCPGARHSLRRPGCQYC